MNGTVIKEFLVGLGFKVDDSSVSKFDGKVKAATVKVAALGTAAVAAAGAVTAFVGAVANRLDEVSDAAIRIGTTADELMRLQYAATLSDSSAQAAAASLQRLGRRAGEAAMGTGEGIKAFEELGIELRDADGQLKSSTDLMGEIGESIRDLERGQQLALMEKLGIDPTMLQTITNGMDTLGAEFDELYGAAGISLNEAAQTSSDFNDALARLQMTFDAVTAAIAVRLMPKIAESFDMLQRLFIDNMPKIIKAVSPVLDLIMAIGTAFIRIVARIAQGAGVLIGYFQRINDATDGMAGYIAAATAAWKLLNLSFLASPIGIILTLGAAIALLVDDFLTWQEGGDSLIDYTKFEPPITAAIEIIKLLGDVVINSIGMIMDVGRLLMQLLTGDFSGAWESLVSLGDRIVDQFGNVRSAFSEVIEIVKFLAEAIFGDLSSSWEMIGSVVDTVVEGISSAVSGVSSFIIETFTSAADSVMSIFQGLASFFTGFFDSITSGIASIGEGAKRAAAFVGFGSDDENPSALSMGVDSVKGLFGFGDDEQNTSTPALTPSPQAAAAVTGGNQNLNQNTEIIVQGTANAQATASAVANQQNRVNADMARNMAGATR